MPRYYVTRTDGLAVHDRHIHLLARLPINLSYDRLQRVLDLQSCFLLFGSRQGITNMLAAAPLRRGFDLGSRQWLHDATLPSGHGIRFLNYELGSNRYTVTKDATRVLNPAKPFP